MLGSRLSLRSLGAGGLSPRGLAQTLFGFVMLGALWVTALTSLSARPTATAVMTEVGANLLNPYLSSAKVGVTESSYAQLLQTATAHPNQSLALTFLKVGDHELGHIGAGDGRAGGRHQSTHLVGFGRLGA